MADYVPGRCNIGPHGRAQRAAGGIVLIALSVLAGWFLRNGGAHELTLLLFLPLFAAFVAVFEAALGFCVVFAERGVYDMR